MSFLNHPRLLLQSALLALSAMPAPINAGTVAHNNDLDLDPMPSGHRDITDTDPGPVAQPTEAPLDQQVLYEPMYEPMFVPRKQDYSGVEARSSAVYEPKVKQVAPRAEDGFKLMQIPRDPGLSPTRRLSVSSKMARAWDKIKPTSLSAEDLARLDEAQQKRDRKAAKRAADRGYHDAYTVRPLYGDRNAYEVL